MQQTTLQICDDEYSVAGAPNKQANTPRQNARAALRSAAAANLIAANLLLSHMLYLYRYMYMHIYTYIQTTKTSYTPMYARTCL